MNIDGKEYEFKLPLYSIRMEDLGAENQQLSKIFSAFDDGDDHLTVNELKQVFGIFQSIDVKDKNNKSDNKLTDAEIQQAIKGNEKLQKFSVGEVKSFIKAIVQVNNKKIDGLKKISKGIAEDIYNQISGPSINANTIKELKRIHSYNAYYVLTAYEKMAKEPLVQALGEEWNFSVANIKYYVLKPLVIQAANLGIGVTHDYYKSENDVKKLNNLAKTLCSAIEKELNTNKFTDEKKTATKLTPSSDTKKSEQKTPAQPLSNEKPADIAKQLYDQISGPSMNKNTIAILKKIGKNNAAQVVIEYKKIAGQTLADAIDEEWGLDVETIKRYICKPLIEQAKEMNMLWAESAEDEYKCLTNMDSVNRFISKWADNIIDVANSRKDVPQKINLADYTVEALKKKYPDKECRKLGSIIIVKNKDGSVFMNIEKNEKGVLRICDKYDKNGEHRRVRSYNPDGTLDYYVIDGVWKGDKGNYESEMSDKLKNTVNELFEDIYHKIGGIVPGTRKSLKENIKQINSYNVLEILALYQNKTGESLFDAINGEIGLGDARKELIEHLNTTLDKAFSLLSDKKDIINYLSEFNNKTGLSLLESISKSSGMPKDKKQAFTDKINMKMQEFIKSINADNVEDILNKSQNINISVTETISKEYCYSKSLKDGYLNHINRAIYSHIQNLAMWEYMYDRVKTDYDDIERPTLTAIIAKEKGLSANDRIKLIRQLQNRIYNEYISSETASDDIKAGIEKELLKLAKNPDDVNVELIDRLNCKLYSRDGYTYNEDYDKQLKAPNGKIDNISYQGGAGDCWLLAAINAIARSKKGLELLNNSLKVNSDGSVTVHLRGVNKTYTISKKDLYAARELSTGDLDVRAIEIAVERYLMETKKEDLNGGWAGDAFNILLGGKKTSWKWLGTKLEDSYIEKINNPNILVAASISDEGRESKVKTSNGEEIHAHHAYTVVKADNSFVYLINPWDGGKLLKLSYKEFKSIFDQFSDVEI